MPSRGACWEWAIPEAAEITGPMALRLWVEARGADDVELFAGVEKWSGRRYILGPSATSFEAGDTLRLVVAGRWLWPRNPLTGQLPASYEKGPNGSCTLHWGPERQARLLVPLIP